MNVLSLFDGMSCGRIALDRLNIKVDNYYSSEIDKYAMKVSEANYPDIIQVGDITALDLSTLPKIDLIMGGSPCQGFSFAGKQLAFDDPRSALFFEFVRCVKELNPKYFLLENVRMKKEYLDVISEQMGVEPICINSALVSAQNRVRYYWTNIPGIEQPEQRGIVLRDILETNESDVLDNIQEKSHVIKAQYYKNSKANFKANNGFRATGIPQKPIQSENGKSPTLTAGNKEQYIETHDTPKKIHDIPRDILKDNERQRRVYAEDGKSPSLLARSDSPKIMKETYDTPKQVGVAVDIKGHDQIKRVYSEDGKSSTLTTCGGGHREPKVAVDVRAMTEVRTPEANQIRYEHKRKTGKDWSPRHMRHLVKRPDEKMNTLTGTLTKQHILQITEEEKEVYWRKLTPVECERLQTVPDNYTNHVSNTQRYKMLGNGWNIETITHILKKIKQDI